MLELNVMRMEGRPPTIHSVWDSFWRVTLVLFFWCIFLFIFIFIFFIMGFFGVSCISETLVMLVSNNWHIPD